MLNYSMKKSTKMLIYTTYFTSIFATFILLCFSYAINSDIALCVKQSGDNATMIADCTKDSHNAENISMIGFINFSILMFFIPVILRVFITKDYQEAHDNEETSYLLRDRTT